MPTLWGRKGYEGIQYPYYQVQGKGEGSYFAEKVCLSVKKHDT